MHSIEEVRTRPGFEVGASVRTRPGVMDPDFARMPLQGWRGTIAEVAKQPRALYLVEWSPDTVRDMPSICRRRCEREDLACNKMWLMEEDLEPDLQQSV